MNLPRIAITPIGLVLHELATNALKYGSLGRVNSRVKIEWTLANAEMTIHWTEHGGPSVQCRATVQAFKSAVAALEVRL